jgi:hypothetical protein
MVKAGKRDIEMVASMYGQDLNIMAVSSSVHHEPCSECQRLLKLLERIRETECQHYIEEGRKLLPLPLRREIQKCLCA